MEVEDPVEVMIFDEPVGITEEEGEGWSGTGREEGEVGGGDVVLVDEGREVFMVSSICLQG